MKLKNAFFSFKKMRLDWLIVIHFYRKKGYDASISDMPAHGRSVRDALTFQNDLLC